MTGILDIFGLPLQGTMSLEKTSSGMVTLIKAAAPAHFKLSQAKGLSSLKGTLLDNIELEELTFIVSSGDYNDVDQNVTYRKGINFVSKTKLSGDLVPVSKFTDIPQTSLLTIIGYLAPNPLESTFKVDIPTGVVIKKSSGEPRNDVTLGKLELEISAITFALLTQLLVKPSAKDDLLTLTARIEFKGAPPTAFLAGTMQGFWSHPFGINGLEIGNVAAEIGFGAAFPPFPASIGVAGQMTLGSRHVAMALKVPIAGDADMVLCGALDKLTLGDMIDTAIKLAGAVSGQKISSVKLPDVGIKDMKVYVAPKDTSIGELHFDKGVTVRGIIFVPGFKAFGNVTVSDSGLIAQASCAEIRYGGTHDNPFLLISRAKEDTTFKDQANQKTIAQSVDAAASTTNSGDDIFGDLDTTPTTPGTQSPGAQAPAIPPATIDSYKKARSADVACAPDNKLLTEYNGPTMHIILNMTAPLDKQGILVSGLFKVADIFEQDSFFRMDQNGIEFNFETDLGKTLYVDTSGKSHPLLKTLINGKSSGGLTNPDFKIILEFQQYLLTYVREQTITAITQAKADVVLGIAGASQSAVKGIDQAKADVKKAHDQLDAINDQIRIVNKKMKEAIDNAGKDRATLDADIIKLKQQISDQQKLCS